MNSYTARLNSGPGDEFFPKLERHLVDYGNKIILGDGATWIWNWAEDNFPGALQILDFYHAKEKLVIYAGHYFKDQHKKNEWTKLQVDRLLDNKLNQVISELQKMKPKSNIAKEWKESGAWHIVKKIINAA